ncbi:MAG: RNA-binding S4 domain-containing protein [Rhizobiales bacterium]|nr:RNA-binding S4 domain-containing protein [Hyphomicrobiales bacterium]
MTARLDKWLWCAHVVRARERAAALIESGAVRLNKQKVVKPGHAVKPGDVVTIALHARVLVYEVIDVADRRGPAKDATRLYRDLAQKTDASANEDG